ncbi:FAD-binding protein, partial [Gammaproteobacteria bacterium]|nr:FAD-binding protein [Gammaproteobacteria bacterium]
EGNALESLGIILFAVIVSSVVGVAVGRFLASKADGPTGPIPTRDYFQGLNHLLNERPDLAVETFIKALPVDDETIDTPPFEAYGVTCGITFTFGGLHVDPEARVIDEAGSPIQGLYAAGEIVGGLFYFNYPGGTGLTSGSVFGRLAGRNAAN